MDAINKIVIDVSDPMTTQVVKAVQEDIRSRFVEITLVRNGEALDIPAGAYGMIGLRRPNQTMVLYDETEDETPAVTFDGNVLTVYLSQEALSVAGDMYTSVSVYSQDGDTRLTAFHFVVSVEETAVPSGAVTATSYFNILQAQVADALDAAERAEAAIQTLTNASTTQAGIVQLVDGIVSTSVTMAPTANAMRMVEPKKLVFSNTTVTTTDFLADATYAGFPYRAAVALTGVSSLMIPDVIFDADAEGFAPVATAYSGGVYIYSVSARAVTIPTIVLWSGV